MPDRQRSFDVFPRIVPADAETEIRIVPSTPADAFDPSATYHLECWPLEGIAPEPFSPELDTPARVEDGALVLSHRFAGEQEHMIFVRTAGTDPVETSVARVYSAGPDLLAMRAYKGDLHLHSTRSDGRAEPSRVPAHCRRIGLDFMALTDHRLYEPSLEAIAAFDGVPLDLAMYPGEEVHAPDNPIHILSLGGAASVNAMYRDDEPAYRAEVARIAARLPASLGRAAYQYASCLWVYGKIREAGALSVFCHPYWQYGGMYNAAEPVIAAHFADWPCDALELIGGFGLNEVRSNMLQLSRYTEEAVAGRRVPIVGVTDTHSYDSGQLFGWYSTIAFAPSPAFADVADAVRSLRSVAVDAPADHPPRIYGPHRFVKFAYYLVREVFPRHDALCAEEGERMAAHLDGAPSAAADLARMKGRVPALMDRYWGRA